MIRAISSRHWQWGLFPKIGKKIDYLGMKIPGESCQIWEICISGGKGASFLAEDTKKNPRPDDIAEIFSVCKQFYIVLKRCQ